MARNYPRFYAICKAIDKTKEEVVWEHTDGRTTSCRDLSDAEFSELFNKLSSLQTVPGNWKTPPGDKQRKKMIGIARNMNWGITTEDTIARLDEFCLRQKKKRMNQLSPMELGHVLTILENKVYAGYLKSLKR